MKAQHFRYYTSDHPDWQTQIIATDGYNIIWLQEVTEDIQHSAESAVSGYSFTPNQMIQWHMRETPEALLPAYAKKNQIRGFKPWSRDHLIKVLKCAGRTPFHHET